MKPIDITNQKFGKLVAIKRTNNLNNKTAWECKCECGNTTIVSTSNLTRNKIKSCGCLKIELLTKRCTKHNQRCTALYEVWKSMKQRCYNSNNYAYHNYGLRGIKVCDNWKNSFINFYEWSINNGYKKGLTIDRINNNGNYEPSNCRWVNRVVQRNNTRFNNYITINNETKTLSEWAKEFGFKPETIRNRIVNLKWSPEKALNTPVKSKTSD